MRNIFGIDLDHNRPGKDKTLYDVMDGQKFRVTGAAGKLAKLQSVSRRSTRRIISVRRPIRLAGAV